jgi:hypothetical protein
VQITLPTKPAKYYTAEQLRTDINLLVKNAIVAEEYGESWPTTPPHSAMIATMETNPTGDPDVHSAKSTYTDSDVVRFRGGMDSMADLTSFSLANGALRSGLPTASTTTAVESYYHALDEYDSSEMTSWTNVSTDNMAIEVFPISNPYFSSWSYLQGLLYPVLNGSDTSTTSFPSDAELRAGHFLMATGLATPGHLQLTSTSTFPHDSFTSVHNTHLGTATTAANFASVTEVGLAIEPLVQGPRDTSGKPAGTLARFVIPDGAQVGSVIPFETKNPVHVDVSRFIGQELTRMRFRLVDQHNDEISNLLDDDWSAVVVIHYDE